MAVIFVLGFLVWSDGLCINVHCVGMEYGCGFDFYLWDFFCDGGSVFCLYSLSSVPLFFVTDLIFSTSEAQWRRRSNATALA